MANERREGTMEDNTMEETNKTVSAPKGVDTVKVIGKMKRKEMQKLRDAKYAVKVEDSSPENQTLEEHDRRHHPDGYKEGDTCKFRENVKTETETDKADVLSPNNPPQTQNQEQPEESREKGEEESEAEKPLKLRVPTEEENPKKGIEVAGEESDLTPEDKEYIEAIKNGDMDKAEKMVREAARAAGYTISAYHGTNTGKFTVFDKNKASPEGDMGAGFYLTSDEDDVSRNYEGGGPDWDNKVARLAERLQDEEDIDDYEEAKKVAEERLKGEKGGAHLIEAYVKMENPAYVDSTMLMEDIGEDLNIDDYDSEDDYNAATEQAISEALEPVIEAVEALGYLGTDDVGSILTEAAYNDGITIPDLKEAMKDVYAEDEEGRLVNSEVIRTIVEALGYDGIIDSTVSEKFKKMDLDYDTTHYIAFSPNQIKSSEAITKDDEGKIIPLSQRFNNKEDDIRYSKTTKPKEEGTDKGFGEEFWGSREGKRIKGYARKYGSAIDEAKQSAQNGYAANFNESGKYKMPLSDGKFSKDFLKRVRGEEVWDKKDRAEAEAAGKLLNNILGNVTIEFSDKPYDGGNSDSRKSIVVDEKTDAEYLEAVNKGDIETAQRMVQEAAAKEYDVDNVQYHMGTLGTLKDKGMSYVIEDNEEGFHIGTLGAATERWSDVINMDDNYEIKAKKEKNGKYKGEFVVNGRVMLSTGAEYDSENDADWETGILLHEALKDESKAKEIIEAGGKKLHKLYVKRGIKMKELPDVAELGEKEWKEYIEEAKKEGYDGIRYKNAVEDVGSESIIIWDSKNIKSADPVTYNDKGNVIPLSERFDANNPDIRYMTSQGKVVGEYDRKNGKITLYPGAKVKDVVHEYAHGLWQFAEQEAKEGRTTLRDKFHKIAKSAPSAVKKAVGEAYKLQGPSVVMEECFTHELARKSEQNQEFAKAIKTASGKSWYKRAWRTIKDTWGGLARKMGYGKADIDKMENMNAHESAEYILKQMAQGKHFGDINPTPDGGGKRKSISGIYTGSEADYDKPSLLKVGTGEGNQVYGWGLYGTNVRGVAEKYAASEEEVERSRSYREYLAKRRDEASDEWERKYFEDELQAAEKAAIHSTIYEQTFFTNRPEGDESHLLKWYSSERPRTLLKKIRSNLTEEQANTFNKMYNKAYRSGPGGSAQAVFNQDIYEMLTDILGSQKDATEFLRDKCDIDGIKYPVDSYSGPIRDGDKEGWNYVSFRDDNIKVDRKWKNGEEVEVNKEEK